MSLLPHPRVLRISKRYRDYEVFLRRNHHVQRNPDTAVSHWPEERCVHVADHHVTSLQSTIFKKLYVRHARKSANLMRGSRKNQEREQESNV